MKTLNAKRIIMFFSTLGLFNSILVQIGLFLPMPRPLDIVVGLDTKVIMKLTSFIVKLISIGYPGNTVGFEYILLPTSGVIWGGIVGIIVYYFLSFLRGSEEDS